MELFMQDVPVFLLYADSTEEIGKLPEADAVNVMTGYYAVLLQGNDVADGQAVSLEIRRVIHRGRFGGTGQGGLFHLPDGAGCGLSPRTEEALRAGKAQGKDAGAGEKQNSAQTERGKRALI